MAQPDALAILAPGRAPLNYGDLFALVARTAARLSALGARPATRIVTVLPEGPQALTGALAVASAATAAPLDPGYGLAEATDRMVRLDADLVVAAAGAELPALRAAEALQIPVVRVAVSPAAPVGVFELEDVGTVTLRQRRPEGNRGAFMLHTGGSTGRPKLVSLGDGQLAASTASMARAVRLEPGDRSFVVMPMFHVHGLIGAGLTSLSAGAAVIFPPALYPPRFGQWITQTGATWITGAPAIFAMLLQHGRTELAAARHHHRLRFVRSCSAPCPPSLVGELEEVSGVPVLEAYGMTEAAHQIASNPLPPRLRKLGSVGRPTGPEIAIVGPDRRRLPDGTPGEIVLQGPSVVTRYEGAGDTDGESPFIDGWLRTGDLGVFDDDGYLFIKGRLKDVINRGGEKIWPTEIEVVLEQHHAVLEAAAFGLAHPVLGECVAAAVVGRPPASIDLADVSAFAAARLGPARRPEPLVLLDQLPRTAAGKLDRRRLAATVAARV